MKFLLRKMEAPTEAYNLYALEMPLIYLLCKKNEIFFVPFAICCLSWVFSSRRVICQLSIWWVWVVQHCCQFRSSTIHVNVCATFFSIFTFTFVLFVNMMSIVHWSSVHCFSLYHIQFSVSAQIYPEHWNIFFFTDCGCRPFKWALKRVFVNKLCKSWK